MKSDPKTTVSACAMTLATVFRHTANDYHLIASVADELGMTPGSISDYEREHLEKQNDGDWAIIKTCCERSAD